MEADRIVAEVDIREDLCTSPAIAQETPDERDVVEKAERFGWMVMNIKDEPGKPGWSHNRAIRSYKHPEVVMFGLKDKSRHSSLNHTATVKERPFKAA